jgi:hypothetical protein
MTYLNLFTIYLLNNNNNNNNLNLKKFKPKIDKSNGPLFDNQNN